MEVKICNFMNNVIQVILVFLCNMILKGKKNIEKCLFQMGETHKKWYGYSTLTPHVTDIPNQLIVKEKKI